VLVHLPDQADVDEDDLFGTASAFLRLMLKRRMSMLNPPVRFTHDVEQFQPNEAETIEGERKPGGEPV